MKKQTKLVSSLLLSGVLATSIAPLSIFANDDHPLEKSETVYALLNKDGSVHDVTISSWLHDEDTIKNVKETLSQSNVENIKGNEQVKKQGNIYTWNSKQKDLYYQGNSKKQLPVNIKIKYELDGKEVNVKQLQGKSGHLKVTLHFTNRIKKEISLNGKEVVVHPSYMAAGMMMLNQEQYQNVTCSNGKIINDGSNYIVTLASVPGLKDTLTSAGLNKVVDKLHVSDEVSMEADVKNCEVSSMMLAISNELEVDDLFKDLSTNQLEQEIQPLFDASNQLVDGSKKLYDGTKAINQKVQPLVNANTSMNQLGSAFVDLKNGTTKLNDGVIAYTDGVKQVHYGQQNLYAIVNGITQGAQGCQSVQQGASALHNGIAKMKTMSDIFDEQNITLLQQELNQAKIQVIQMEQMLKNDQQVVNQMGQALQLVKQQMNALNTFKQQFAQSIVAYNTQVVKNNQIIQTNNQSYAQTKQAYDEKVAALNVSMDQSIALLQEAKNQTKDDALKTKIDTQIQSLQTLKQTQLDAISFTSLEVIDPKPLLQQFQALASKLPQVEAMFTQAQTSLKQLEQDVETSKLALKTMEEKMQMLVNGLGQQDPIQLIQEFKQGVNALYDGSGKLVEGSKKLNAGLTTLQHQSKSGIDALNAGSLLLVNKSSELLQGMNQLQMGTTTLASQKNKLNEMANGLQQLKQGLLQLEQGSKSLYDGQQRFNQEGMGTLKEKLNLTTQEFKNLETIQKEIEALNKKHSNFDGAPKDAQTSVRYIYKTKE